MPLCRLRAIAGAAADDAAHAICRAIFRAFHFCRLYMPLPAPRQARATLLRLMFDIDDIDIEVYAFHDAIRYGDAADFHATLYDFLLLMAEDR